MAKFSRKDLVNVMPGRAVTFTVTGELESGSGNVQFAGTDTIRVIQKNKKPVSHHPKAFGSTSAP